MITPDFDKTGGLIPVIAQDYKTGEVLMLGFMNQKAWETTLNTGKATYWSRSRQELWVKGQTSGNQQIVKEIRIDCDFHKKIEDGSVTIIGEPVFDPKEVYGK
jgi:phosphoribosyl-AMP cyclohydrolase